MLKRYLLIALTLVLLVSCLPGCSNEPKLNPEDYVKVAENGSTDYVLVNCGADAVKLAKFGALLKTQMGGAQLKIVTKAPETGKGIYVGVAEQIEKISGFTLVESYAHYSIRADENGNLYIFTVMKEMLTEALNVAAKLFVEVKKGMFGFAKNTNVTAGVSGVEEAVPMFDSKNAILVSDLYTCSNGDIQVRYNQVGNRNEVLAYVTELEQAGFTRYTGNEVGKNLFATYVKGNTLVHISFFATHKQLHIVFGVKGHLLSNQPIELSADQKVVVPSITQMYLSHTGLSMVLQLADGSFYVIDGGRYEPDSDGDITETINAGAKNEKHYTFKKDTAGDVEKLWQFIQANTPEGQRPQITWMITHGDTDHVGGAVHFIKSYAGQFDLVQVCYNFPNDNASVAFVGAVKQFYPDTPHYIMRTGDKFYLPGNAELEILCTMEDLNELEWSNWNITSAAWRFTVEGKTILITGDTETGPNTKMYQTYGGYLKSDIYQVPHHGANGGVLSMTQAVDPSICFWAVSQEKFENDNRMGGTAYATYDHTKWLRQSPDVKAHYHQSETVTLELPSMEKR